MDRRKFIAGLTSSSFLALGIGAPEQPYIFKFKLIPKQNSQQTFSTTRDFFKFYGGDASASSLNSFFINRGWLQKVETNLSADGMGIVVHKTYRSRFYKALYSSLWAMFSRGKSEESKKFYQVKLEDISTQKKIT